MDPIGNPYAPGAGTPPPELAGRDDLREAVRVALARVRLARLTRSVLMVGLRGVGETVLLDRMREDAEATGAQTLLVEVPRGPIPARDARAPVPGGPLKLSRHERARDLAQRALKGRAGFTRALKLKYDDFTRWASTSIRNPRWCTTATLSTT